jgi:type IV pilus assembly protein PilM
MAKKQRSSIFAKLSGALSFGGSDTVVGLSIGSSSIKLVELKKSRKTWNLLHFGIVQLPEDVIINREIMNPVAVTESIKTLLQQMKLKTKFVCTSLSGTSMIIKRMTLEVPNPKELQDQVFWEAEQYLPFDVAEVVMDYQTLSRSKDAKTDVLLVAVKKTVLDSYMTCIEDAGLVPKVVDVDFFALQNLYELNYPTPKPEEAIAVVDIGACSIKVVVIHNGIPVFTKDSSIGGKNLTAEIQRHLDLSYADAEALKTGSQEGTPQEVSELMGVMNENLATEIKRALDFYGASSAGAPISGILLAGGSAKIPGLSQVVENHLSGLPVSLLNPFNMISYDPGVFTPEYMNSIAPIASIAVGLALRAAAK